MIDDITYKKTRDSIIFIFNMILDEIHSIQEHNLNSVMSGLMETVKKEINRMKHYIFFKSC